MTSPPEKATGAVAPKRRSASQLQKLPAMQFADAAIQAPDKDLQGRLMGLAEKEQNDGIEVVRRADATARRGQAFGLLAVALVLALAGYVATLGQASWAAVITGIDVVGVAGVFVTGQFATRRRAPRNE